MTFAEAMAVITDTGKGGNDPDALHGLITVFNELENFIGYSLETADVETDMGRLIAITDNVLTTLKAVTHPDLRQALLHIAGKATNRALWLSAYDPTVELPE